MGHASALASRRKISLQVRLEQWRGGSGRTRAADGQYDIAEQAGDTWRVRGARMLATLAPYADEISIYPGSPLRPEDTAYAVREGELTIVVGTDGNTPYAPHVEMEDMVMAGMTPMQVIVSSTWIASRAMGLDKQLGTIEKGKDADLVIVSADPSADIANLRKIRYVVRSGVVRPISGLSAMAQ